MTSLKEPHSLRRALFGGHYHRLVAQAWLASYSQPQTVFWGEAIETPDRALLLWCQPHCYLVGAGIYSPFTARLCVEKTWPLPVPGHLTTPQPRQNIIIIIRRKPQTILCVYYYWLFQPYPTFSLISQLLLNWANPNIITTWARYCIVVLESIDLITIIEAENIVVEDWPDDHSTICLFQFWWWAPSWRTWLRLAIPFITLPGYYCNIELLSPNWYSACSEEGFWFNVTSLLWYSHDGQTEDWRWAILIYSADAVLTLWQDYNSQPAAVLVGTWCLVVAVGIIIITPMTPDPSWSIIYRSLFYAFALLSYCDWWRSVSHARWPPWLPRAPDDYSCGEFWLDRPLVFYLLLMQKRHYWTSENCSGVCVYSVCVLLFRPMNICSNILFMTNNMRWWPTNDFFPLL